MQFVQFTTMQYEVNCLNLEKIVLKALSEHIIKDIKNEKYCNPYPYYFHLRVTTS